MTTRAMIGEMADEAVAVGESPAVLRIMVKLWARMKHECDSKQCKRCERLVFANSKASCRRGINIPTTALGEVDLTFGCNLFTGMD